MGSGKGSEQISRHKEVSGVLVGLPFDGGTVLTDAADLTSTAN